MLHSEVRKGAKLQVIVPQRPGQYKGAWEVIKVNPVNIKLRHTETMRTLNAAPTYLHPMDVVIEQTAVTSEFIPYVPATKKLTKGMVVEASDPRLAMKMIGYFVVTGTAGGKNQLSALGGSTDGLYWSVRTEHLKVVDIDELLGLTV